MNIITCIHKRGDHYDPFERITHIGGRNSQNQFFKLTSEEVINMIDSGKYTFHVVKQGRNVKVLTDTRNGKKYLKTEADSFQPDNLLALPECPLIM